MKQCVSNDNSLFLLLLSWIQILKLSVSSFMFLSAEHSGVGAHLIDRHFFITYQILFHFLLVFKAIIILFSFPKSRYTIIIILYLRSGAYKAHLIIV